MKKNRQSAPTKLLQCTECSRQRPREGFPQTTWRAAQAAIKDKKEYDAVCKACAGSSKRQLFPCAKCGERKDKDSYEEWAWPQAAEEPHVHRLQCSRKISPPEITT